jgi:2-polyprenyl-3-methyl-5-hydroxy-6-metoxy-1,4-benzoquinol methylase
MELTTGELWDQMWASLRLPAEVDHSDPYIRPIVSKIESHFPQSARTIIELGGAPGGYLAYFARHGLSPIALEQSAIGCEQTRENWRLLGVVGEVIQGDLFEPASDRYDIVYSLGLIEHFDDLTDVVGHHLKFLNPGGLLVVGCPNFRGVYRGTMQRLAPERLGAHHLETMNVTNWDAFESEFELTRLFRGYVGGFEPRILLPFERSNLTARATARSTRLVSRALRLPVLRRSHRLNHPALSGYVLGVYRSSDPGTTGLLGSGANPNSGGG